MNRNAVTTTLWGLFVLLLGVAGLLYNFGVLDEYKLITTYVVAGLLAALGLGFLILIVFQQDRWLFAVPGCSFLTLASVVYLTSLGTIAPVYLGALFLAGIAAGFLVIFLSNRRQRWWALLQAGTITVIAVIGMGVGVPAASESLIGASLFGGFALSFLLLYLFGGEHRRFLWALIMAGVLAVFSASLLAAGYGEGNVIVRLWPIVLILLGVFMIGRVLTGRVKPSPVQPGAPVPQPQYGDLEPVISAPEPARIVRGDGDRGDVIPTVTPVAPMPEVEILEVDEFDPATIPSEEDDLPAHLQEVNPDDPSAALDRLLDASWEEENDVDDEESPAV